MNKQILIVSLVLAGLISSCDDQDQSQSAEIDLEETFQELSEDINTSIWEVQSDGELFELEIPNQMKQMDELNPTAKLEFGYYERLGADVKENYIIVMPHQIAELEEESPNQTHSIQSYAELSVNNMMEGKSSYEILNDEALEQINGMDAIIHEIRASMSVTDSTTVDLYYMLGVFEGEKTFYQVLSWTLLDQKDDFRADMRHMIYSFKEI